ncbi:hypothetical protein JYU34_006928 [Plutella xylostella]|uniref:PHD-type domain-containing protein n=1 Tax=Plutella xylostella TaxID=51655 RepID=A0ABQ7QTA1_PLUXY|nr:hypothetical protein JYU34_006928 [Plutella xylostella]
MTALQESTMKLYDALSALRPAPPPPLLQPPGKRYVGVAKANTTALAAMTALQESTMKLYDALSALRPAPPPPLLQPPGKRALAVPTAAALKMGVGFPLSDNPDATHGKVLSTSLQASPSQLTPSDSGTCCVCARPAARRLLATCDCCQRHYHPACLRPPLPRPPKKTKLYGWQCSECDKTSDSEPEVIEKKGPRRSRIRYSKDGAILPASPPPGPAPDSLSPIKVTIKPFEFTENDAAEKKKDKKLKKAKLKEQTSAAEMDSAAKKLKRSFTSPTLTNTPLMSITPIVAESPNDSHNENSNTSTAVATKADTSFLSTNSSFSSLIGEAKEKERDSKAIETSIETTLANLSSDIATYKANRKRRKEKHRSRYSPDLLRSPTKSHKHKRKKKAHPQLENPDMPHPRITIKIKPIPKPAGSTDTQMFYVPSDSNDAPPPPVVRTIPKQVIEEIQREPEAIVPIEPLTADQLPKPKEDKPVEKEETETETVKPKSSERGRTPAVRGRGRGGGARGPPRDLPALTHCDVCSQPGAPANLVRCDECFKRYHLSCLEPPLSKNPKKRGYSWHCADCDPTDVEDNN